MPITAGRKAVVDVDSPMLLAAVEAALLTAEDWSIREALGLAEWRVVDAAVRAQYVKYFAPRALEAVRGGMRRGLLAGRLNIQNFAVFEIGPEPVGELFPVAVGPCIEADMINVDVTISAGPSEYAGELKAEYEGAWYSDGDGIFAAEYAHVDLGSDLFAVKGCREIIVDYGGLLQKTIYGAAALIVRGHIEPRPHRYPTKAMRYDLVVDDPKPQIEGVVRVLYNAAWPPAPYWGFSNGYIGRGQFVVNPAYSAWFVDKFAGKSAVEVLSRRNVHTMDLTGFPLGASAFVGCFPRKKWIVKYQSMLNGQLVDNYGVVAWIRRAAWMAAYGDDLQYWKDAGAVVPAEKLTDRVYQKKIYAKFAPSVIEALNP